MSCGVKFLSLMAQGHWPTHTSGLVLRLSIQLQHCPVRWSCKLCSTTSNGPNHNSIDLFLFQRFVQKVVLLLSTDLTQSCPLVLLASTSHQGCNSSSNIKTQKWRAVSDWNMIFEIIWKIIFSVIGNYCRLWLIKSIALHILYNDWDPLIYSCQCWKLNLSSEA